LLDTLNPEKKVHTEVLMRRQRYPQAFKTVAVKQAADAGYRVTEVAARRGVITHTTRSLAHRPASTRQKADEQPEIGCFKKEPTRVAVVGCGCDCG